MCCWQETVNNESALALRPILPEVIVRHVGFFSCFPGTCLTFSFLYLFVLTFFPNSNFTSFFFFWLSCNSLNFFSTFLITYRLFPPCLFLLPFFFLSCSFLLIRFYTINPYLCFIVTLFLFLLFTFASHSSYHFFLLFPSLLLFVLFSFYRFFVSLFSPTSLFLSLVVYIRLVQK